MYRNSYQRGMLTVFFSVGSKPLAIWETHTQDGYVTRFLDQDIKSMVLELGGTNVSTTFISCPKGNQVLGITMPFLVMVVKNLKKYFSFEVTILDETFTRRRFRVSNFQSSTQILPLCTVMPIGLAAGWNQIQFNLAEFTRRAYKKQFLEVQKLKINANIRLRRVYFTERLIPDDELPPEYKLYFPLTSKGAKEKKTAQKIISDKENVQPLLSQQPIVGSLNKPSKASLHSTKTTTSQTKPGDKVENIEGKEEELSFKETELNEKKEEVQNEAIEEIQNEEVGEVENEAIEEIQNEEVEEVKNEVIEEIQNEEVGEVENEAMEGKKSEEQVQDEELKEVEEVKETAE